MSEWALSDVERLRALDEADRTFQMTEEAFRAFYELTARPLWGYLARMSGDRRAADDLLQETYYRFLKSTTSFEDDAHRRNYLFRIATNLVQDQRRRPRVAAVPVDEADRVRPQDTGGAGRVAARVDLTRALQHLKPRERSLLWLAYVHGWSHEELARATGLRASSMKMLLFRARQRLLGLLEPKGDIRRD